MLQRRAVFGDAIRAAARERVVEVVKRFLRDGVPHLDQVLVVQRLRARHARAELGQTHLDLALDRGHQVLDYVEVGGVCGPLVGLQRANEAAADVRVVAEEVLRVPDNTQ